MRHLFIVLILFELLSCKKATESYVYLYPNDRAKLEKAYTVGDTTRFVYTKDQITDTLIYVVSSISYPFVAKKTAESPHTYNYEQIEVQLSCLNQVQPITLNLGLRDFDIPDANLVSERYLYIDLREETYQIDAAEIDLNTAITYDFRLSGNFVDKNHLAQIKYSPDQGIMDIVDTDLGYRYMKID